MIQLKVSTWNINQRSGFGNQVPDIVFSELAQLNSDILIITEYVKGTNHFEFCEQLQSLGYAVFEYLEHIEKLQNEILIVVKTKLVINPLLKNLPQGDKFPDFLHLQVDLEDEPLHIIGTRIKIATISDALTYKRKLPLQIIDAQERLLQIKHIAEYVKKLSGKILLMGDFNNFHYYENQTVNSWEYDKEFLQNYYSYPLLVAKMTEVNLTAYSPTGNYDEVYSWVNPKLRECNLKRYIRNDHIFSNIAEIRDTQYSWNFLKNPDYQNKVGYPDHGILTATISL